MKTTTLFLIGAFIFCFASACSNAPIADTHENTNTTDTLNIGCLASYELIPGAKTDTINKVYGKEQIKHGRWIDYELNPSPEKPSDSKPLRVITGMGHYRKNKKHGLWKFFKPDGSIKDSIQFRNDTPLVKVTSNEYFKHLILAYPPTCPPSSRKCS